MILTNNNFLRSCGSLFQSHVRKAAWTVSNSDTLCYGVKGMKSVIDIAVPVLNSVQGPQKTAAGLVKLGAELNSFGKFLGSVKVLQRGKDWIVTSDHEKKEREKEGWRGVASRISLTVGQAMESANFLGSLDLVSIPADTLGNIPVFNLVKDGFILGACFLGLWSTVEKLQAVKAKSKDWAVIAGGNNESLQQHYQTKVADAGERNPRKWEVRRDNIDLVRTYKDEKFRFEKKKQWLGIISNISKIAIITLGTAALALGVQGVAATAMGLAGISIAVNGIGLGKKIFEKFHNPIPQYKTQLA